MRDKLGRFALFIVIFIVAFAYRSGWLRRKPEVLVPPPSPSRKALSTIPDIMSESEEGFVDLVLLLAERKPIGESKELIVGNGRHKGKDVGVGITLDGVWGAKALSPDMPIEVRSGKLRFRRLGEESDALIQAMAQLYSVKTKSMRMKNEVEFTAMSLGGDPGHLDREPTQIKVFYESNNDDEYAELYVNIDVAARRVELHEKDPGYRQALIRALSEAGSDRSKPAR
jgi:hypothetical protein